MNHVWRTSTAIALIILASSAPIQVFAQGSLPVKSGTGTTTEIDLPTALQLAGANNLDLAIAREAMKQAEAQELQATEKFFPYFTLGTQYAGHDGAFASADGTIIETNKEAYGNAAAVGAQMSLGDAIFQKMATRELSAGAAAGVDAQKGVTVLSAATGYFDLVSAAVEVGIARDALGFSQSYQDQLERAVGIGLANRSDALGVRVQTQSYQIALRQAEEQLRSAAAVLAQTLHIASSGVLTPHDTVPVPVTVVQGSSVEDLTARALSSRPELTQSLANINAADWARLGGTYGPLLPTISAQYADGELRGGPNGAEIGFRHAQDTAVMLNWRIGAGGLFDIGRINEAESKLHQAVLGDLKLRDDIVRQVIQSYEAVQSAKDQIALARDNVENATQALNLAQQRKEFGVAAVLETIQTQQQLVQARRDLAKAITQHNKAQYSLAHAIATPDLSP